MNKEPKFTTAKGISVTFRRPSNQDLKELVRYVNELSEEDTYLTLSGEKISQEEESAYLDSSIGEMEKGDRIQYFAYIGAELVGNADVHRVKRFRKRALHVGEVAISVAKKWRGQGIGKKMLELLIEESKTQGFRLLILDAFSINTGAIALYQKLGFKIIGEIPGAVWYRGRYVGQIHMYQLL